MVISYLALKSFLNFEFLLKRNMGIWYKFYELTILSKFYHILTLDILFEMITTYVCIQKRRPLAANLACVYNYLCDQPILPNFAHFALYRT